MVKTNYISHLLLKITKRESETIQLVNLAKSNLKPMPGKMVKFGKAIGKYSVRDSNESGVRWYKTQDDKWKYKYKSPYLKDYNKSGRIRDEIIIYAKPGKITSYIFYDKSKQTLYFGVTDSSFTFHPNQVVYVYSEELTSLEEVPLFIDICFVDGAKKVQLYKRDMNLSPIPLIMLSFKPRIFSSNFNISELENPVFGEPNIRNSIQLPYTGLNKKELVKKWLQFKNGIPRQIPQREVNPNRNIVHRVMNDGYNSDEEPLDVRRERLKRNAAIERAIEEAYYEPEVITIDRLPEPDENGYYHFNEDIWPNNYDIDNPTAIFQNLRNDDNGGVSVYTINGNFYDFLPDREVRTYQGQYCFYWCPTDGSFGVRYKKVVDNNNNRERTERTGDGDGNNDRDRDENQPAHMVNKYIYLQVLNPSLDGEMTPTTIDLYTKSFYHLGRINYEQFNINRKEQIFITKRQLELQWESKNNN